jgi:hypothetical protein
VLIILVRDRVRSAEPEWQPTLMSADAIWVAGGGTCTLRSSVEPSHYSDTKSHTGGGKGLKPPRRSNSEFHTMRDTALTLLAQTSRACFFAACGIRSSGWPEIEAKLQNRTNALEPFEWLEFHNALSEKQLERRIETRLT